MSSGINNNEKFFKNLCEVRWQSLKCPTVKFCFSLVQTYGMAHLTILHSRAFGERAWPAPLLHLSSRDHTMVAELWISHISPIYTATSSRTFQSTAMASYTLLFLLPLLFAPFSLRNRFCFQLCVFRNCKPQLFHCELQPLCMGSWSYLCG